MSYANSLIEEGKFWEGLKEYMRAQALIERDLALNPESESLQKAQSELNQLSYLVQVKLESQSTNGTNLIKISGDGSNNSLGFGDLE